jgi:SAM-dependent methyltransferase
MRRCVSSRRVPDDWTRTTRRVTTAFDNIADLYREKFARELDGKPFDRALLERVAARIPRGEPVLEVGAGPGQIGAFLHTRGVPTIASDASLGQLREARVLAPERPAAAVDLARLPVRAGALGAIVAFYCLIYGPQEAHDVVFHEWRRALRPDGLAVIAVQAGTGSMEYDGYQGRPARLTIVMRDPDLLVKQLERNGFAVDECVVRPPYDGEGVDRCYVVASVAA